MTEAAWLERLQLTINSAMWRDWTSQFKAKVYARELDLHAVRSWTYDLDKLIKQATLGQTIVSRFLSPDRDQNDAMQLGRFWEGLTTFDEYVNPSTAIMSALAYEAAGSSANSAAVIRKFRHRNDPGGINDPLLRCVEMLLERRLLLLRLTMESLTPEDYKRAGLGSSGLLEAIEEFASYLLSGDEAHLSSGQLTLDRTVSYLRSEGDTGGHLVATGLLRLMATVAKRSIWTILGGIQTGSPALWERYLKLLARGPGRALLEGNSVTELWPSQRAAIDGGLLNPDVSAMAIRMPTSSGKTRVAEMAIVKALADDRKAKVVYVAPYRALASELSISFKRLFGDLGYSVGTSLLAFDYDVLETELLSDFDIAILTPERLDLLSRLNPPALERISLVILDEGHLLGDDHRGIKTELLLSRLRERLPKARFVVASAMMSDPSLRAVSAWLTSRREGQRGAYKSSPWRPALQQLATFRWDGETGTLELIDSDSPDQHESIPNVIRRRELKYVDDDTQHIKTRTIPENKADIAAELAIRLSQLGPVLVYAAQPDWTIAIADRVQQLIQVDEDLRPAWWGNISDVPGRAQQIAADWSTDERLVYRLNKGLAVHHGDLPDALKDAIEKDARDGSFRIIIATGTLSTGVNIPIRSVVFHSWGRFENRKTVPMPPSDYWNVLGRAGRAGCETEGLAVHIICTEEDQEAFENYRSFSHEGFEVQSRLLELAELVEKGICESDDAGALLDPEILPLLVEDVSRDDAKTLVSQVLEGSLAAQQASHISDLFALNAAMTTQAESILRKIPSSSARLAFSRTGLTSTECTKIASMLSRSPAVRDVLLTGSANELIEVVTAPLFTLPRFEDISQLPTLRDSLLLWIKAAPVSDVLLSLAESSIDRSRAGKIIDRYFRYYAPWYISAILRIATFVFEDDIATYSPECQVLPAMLRNGVPSVTACYAVSLGAPTRRAAVAISEAFDAAVGDKSFASFRKWLIYESPSAIAKRLGVHGQLLEDVLDGFRAVGRRSQVVDSIRDDEILPRIVQARITLRVLRAAELQVGMIIECRRSYESLIDRNLVEVYHKGSYITRLQSDDEHIVAAELDAGQKILAEVLKVESDRGRLTLRLYVSTGNI